MRRLTLLLLLATLASGCASLPGKTTTKIDDRRVEYVLSRKGNATVVFENGLGATLDWWAKVVPEIANDATTFAYNRPGYGNSDAATTPRDGIHVVDELRALLESQGLRPPYVLVGHSLGGLYMQLFARRYPDEVSALVLVDSTHPEQLKGAGARENWPAWARVVFGVATSATAKQEMDVIDATGEEVLRLSTFTGKPVIVLSALQPMSKKSALADDANAKRKDIARLYPGSSQIWVDSGHGIPLEKPTAVISKIREVLPRRDGAYRITLAPLRFSARRKAMLLGGAPAGCGAVDGS